jgi:hypothetical protein
MFIYNFIDLCNTTVCASLYVRVSNLHVFVFPFCVPEKHVTDVGTHASASLIYPLVLILSRVLVT